ncbi:MAG: DUF4349 domain-containing protein [Chloroflexi bacterium]|nr:DUF4349 domain-containing protein [Chloroflexota bacterium]
MNTLTERRTLLVVAGVVIGATILISAALSGGQTSHILSTVGSAINNQPGSGGATDTSGGDSGSGSGSGSDPDNGSGSGTSGQVADAAVAAPSLLIVRTGTLEMEVADLAAALRDGDAAVIRAGGYISGSSRIANGRDASADVTYRIPSAAWDATLSTLHGLGSKIATEKIETEEVTGQVIDLTARIANLRATEAALQAIMAKAARISDVLDVQEQLTETRGAIEKLVADKEHLVDRAAYGSLAVTYRLPPTVEPAPTARPVKGWDPADDVARATGRLVRIGQTSTSIGIWLAIVGLPLAIGGTILALVTWQLSRLARWLLRRRESAAQAA